MAKRNIIPAFTWTDLLIKTISWIPAEFRIERYRYTTGVITKGLQWIG
jgi:hypothetical protein